VLQAKGNYLEARNVAEQAVSLGRETLGPLAPRFGTLLTTQAKVLLDLGNTGRALKLYRQALDIFTKSGQANTIDLGTAYENLASAYALQSKPKKALEAVNLALVSWKQDAPQDAFVAALNTKMIGYLELKAYHAAESLVPEMLTAAMPCSGCSDPDRVVLLGNAASLYIAEKQYEKAEPSLRRAFG
jgi:tetratricopeptide (TPR) repeat protein